MTAQAFAGGPSREASTDSGRKKRGYVSFAASIGIHAAIFLLIGWMLKLATGSLPLLTEVSLMGSVVPKGGGSETSLSSPPSVAEPAAVPGERHREKDAASVPVKENPPSGEKIVVAKPKPKPRALTAKEIKARFVKQFGGLKGVAKPGLPPSETQDLPAGTGDEGTLGTPTGTEITGDILSRGVVSLEKPVCKEKLGSVYEVTLLISVSPDGRVLDTIKVLTTASKADLLNLSLAAIKKWRFQSLPPGADPVIQSGTITFKFVPE